MTETKSLAEALAHVQAKLPRITKTETAQVRSDKGSYSYSYADLADVSAQIMPLLGEHGLSFICKPTHTPDGRFVLAYSLLHVSGGREDGEYPLPTGGTPQALGSAITYGRRYCLCAVTGVAPDDDDDDAQAAQQASRPAPRQQSRRQPQRRQPRPPEQGDGDTDWMWVEQFEERVKQIASSDDLRAMKREVQAQFKAGKLQPSQANELMKLCDQTISALEAA